ncbi:MAG: hypothetical protein HYY65_09125, partial [Candidatus Tectomicrobia bacterium]|nr:hypothetical protein [Candidatus Tectomicrobia bacterium]
MLPSEHAQPSIRSQALRFPLYLLCVFVIGLSVLSYEIILTRFFSALFSYHFVFVAVSLAVLGLGLGGLLAARLPKPRGAAPLVYGVLQGRAAFFLGLSLVVVLVLFAYFPWMRRVWFLSLIALPPFGAAGYSLALTMRLFSSESSRVYWADLSGGALGTLLVVVGLQKWGPVVTLLLLVALITLISGLCFLQARSWKWLGAVASLFLALLPLWELSTPGGPVDLRLNRRQGSGNQLSRLFQNPAPGTTLVSSEWNAFARTDVVEIWEDGRRARFLFTDGGGASRIPQFPRDLLERSWVEEDPGLFPFLAAAPRKVLVIGAGGGRDVLLSLRGGAEEITAVDVNPEALRAVRRYAGDLARLKNVRWVVDEGRGFLQRSKERYDLIYLPLVYTDRPEAISYSLVENYIFTREAFREYLNHLTERGLLVIRAHDFNDFTRAALTALEALEGRSGNDSRAMRHLIGVHRSEGFLLDPQAMSYPLLLVRNTPYQPQESSRILKIALGAGLYPIFIPELVARSPFSALAAGGETPQQFSRRFPQNLSPTWDDRPFFYQTNRFPPRPLLLLLLFVSAVLLALLFVYLRRGEDFPVRRPLKAAALYFSALGVGYMLIEVALLQRFIQILGFPTLTFSVLLFVLLLSGGVGSWCSRLIPVERGTRFILVLGFLLLVASFLFFRTLPSLVSWAASQELWARSLVSMGVLFPLGFVLGIPFPLGVRLLEDRGLASEIPWMWGLNGVASVLGSVAAVA